jgi:hypothetical protein
LFLFPICFFLPEKIEGTRTARFLRETAEFLAALALMPVLAGRKATVVLL